MERVEDRRVEIYDYFHGNSACQHYFYDSAREEEYVAYYNSMYLLHDSTESLWWHRHKGFASDPKHAYIEFWGLMQAVIIQQDAITELTQVITGGEIDTKSLPAWSRIRVLRNTCVGHPVRRDIPRTSRRTRSFLCRTFGGYEVLKYEQWQQGVGTTHPEVRLGELLDAYAAEAEVKLSDVLSAMRSRWSQ